MKVKYGKGKTEFGPGVQIDLTGDEVAQAITSYLHAHDVHINGARTVRVNGELCQKGSVYVDPSGFVIDKGEKIDGKGEPVSPNTLYFTDGFVSGKLIDNNWRLTHKANKVQLTTEECTTLMGMLTEGYSDFSHRCMSVYRDAIIISGVTYNICLSCGDFYVGDIRIFIDNEDKIKSFLNEIKNRADEQ